MTMDSILGSVLAVALLALMGLLLLRIVKSPFIALGILVAGMAVHNLVLMVLLSAGTPSPLVRLVQAWKEITLAVLVVVALWMAWVRSRSGSRPQLLPLDWVAIASAALVIGSFGLELVLDRSGPSLAQRLLSLRLNLLPPLLYALGRVFWPANLGEVRFTRWAILLSAAFVGLFGLWELWFVPTVRWVDWGAIDFSRLLGYDYHGPGGLPANFFQSTNSGYGLRRMVSSYLSPLGIAYTGVLVLPLAAATVMRRSDGWRQWLAWGSLALLVAAITLSVTRLAFAVLAMEAILFVILVRRWRAVAIVAIVLVAVGIGTYGYPNFGPRVRFDLTEVASVTSFLRQGGGSAARNPTASPTPAPNAVVAPNEAPEWLVARVFSGEDQSVRAHIEALAIGTRYILQHPLGTGPGSAIPRFGTMQGPAESALLRIGGELGIAGALLHLIFYGGVVVAAWLAYRRVGAGWQRGFALVTLIGGIGLIPIMLTSDVWGNFSVTFLFWWCAGLTVSAAQRAKVVASDSTIGL